VSDEPAGRRARRNLDEQLGALLKRAREQQVQLAILAVAADGVAWVNRRWGRAAGDSVLRKIARRLAARLAPADTFTRYEGNRFCVIRRSASQDEAAAFAQKLAAAVADAPFEIPGGRDAAFLTISVGVTMAEPSSEAGVLVAAAEAALRQAKDAGGDRVVVG
jgi:two-component system cell cycle response regulator